MNHMLCFHTSCLCEAFWVQWKYWIDVWTCFPAHWQASHSCLLVTGIPTFSVGLWKYEWSQDNCGKEPCCGPPICKIQSMYLFVFLSQNQRQDKRSSATRANINRIKETKDCKTNIKTGTQFQTNNEKFNRSFVICTLSSHMFGILWYSVYES